jgi:hypothetical protein
MSDFIPKPPTQKIGGLGPKAARLQALREKAQANNDAGKNTHAAASTTAKANTSSHKKTAFQRKAT